MTPLSLLAGSTVLNMSTHSQIQHGEEQEFAKCLIGDQFNTQSQGGGGGGGTLIFSAYVGSVPASTVHTKKISGI